ncbi:DUF927 domain-containing protein [Desulfovibrio psychrotolerans]|uniref:DUF927 domain-containing protein n=1 Tax=Desulfovibrio psychrotolerans TaxID=415242 RepID=A0A7J0BQH2_9BACT|nr:DUF927 domain-containing protein [Desulfovibrio psychrotolerans]GFM35963.1 hypothetical protein DSM19430T_06470 [Desulfovibrio psychrotolerans]
MSKIDFDSINSAARSSFERVLANLLPDGRIEGGEYVARNPTRADSRPGSFKVNIATGMWSDFATGDSGNDPVNLYAYVKGMKQSEAARELAKMVGVAPTTDTGICTIRTAQRARENGGAQRKSKSDWLPIVPVPDDAPAPPRTHFRHGAPAATWPYKDQNGALLGYVCRFDVEGGKQVLPLIFCSQRDNRQWRWQSWSVPRPLYGLDTLAAAPEASVLIVEGEKAAEAAGVLSNNTMVVITWPGGSKAISKIDWNPLKGRRVCIWPDNDEPGFKAALDIASKAQEVGFTLVGVVLPSADWEKAADIADFASQWTTTDFHQEIKTRKVDVEVFRAEASKRYDIDGGSTAPSQNNSLQFLLRTDGVYFVGHDEDGIPKPPEWVCSPLKVLARTRDEEGKNWGRLLEIVDPDGKTHTWAMPMDMTAGNGDTYRGQLLSFGLRLAAGKYGKSRLHMYLTQYETVGRARCVSRNGWHSGCFVLPDKTYGDTAGEHVVYQGLLHENLFREQGSLADWQENVGCYCVGNSRFAFAVSAAFAGPLLKLVHGEGGGFHFYGGSSVGKTTIVEVAGSVCGGGGDKGFVKQWRSTDNALEGLAYLHNDGLLVLDEVGQAQAKVAGETAYMLANGQGKSRASKTGAARNVATWCLVFLSTGELTMADKIAEDGRKAMAGQSVRVVDIPADAGKGMKTLEALHTFASGGELANHFKAASKRFYGTPLRAFLSTLTSEPEKAAQRVTQHMEAFCKRYVPDGADGQVSRVARRFGLVAAAGELATEYSVLPWPTGEATRAAATCFAAWLNCRGGVGSAELSAGIEQVVSFFQAHGASRFEDTETDTLRTVINRVGYLKTIRGERCFCVFPSAFRREVCNGYDSSMLAKALADKRLLYADKGRNTKNVWVDGKTVAFVVLSYSILGVNDANGVNAVESIEENSLTLPEAEVRSARRNAGDGAEPSHSSHVPCMNREGEMDGNSNALHAIHSLHTENSQSENKKTHPDSPSPANIQEGRDWHYAEDGTKRVAII